MEETLDLSGLTLIIALEVLRKRVEETLDLSGLTLIIALEVMRKRVARSLTALIFSPPSTGTRSPSSSLSDRCSAAPCLAIRSLQVLRSSSLLTSVFSVPWISLRSDCDVGSSSPESSGRGQRSEVSYAAAGCGEDHTSLSTQYFGDTKEMDNVII